MDFTEAEGHQNEREPSANWRSGNSNYTAAPDDPSSSYSPYLPPVLEEPSSSFSEGEIVIFGFLFTVHFSPNELLV